MLTPYGYSPASIGRRRYHDGHSLLFTRDNSGPGPAGRFFSRDHALLCVTPTLLVTGVECDAV